MYFYPTNRFLKLFRRAGIAILLLFLYWASIHYIAFCPYVYIFGGIAGLLFYLMTRPGRSENFKLLLFNLSLIFVVLAGFEDYLGGWYFLGRLNKNIHQEQWSGNFYSSENDIRDSIRGKIPPSDRRFSSRKVVNGMEVFDVIYTTNHQGLRVSPHDIKPMKFRSDVRDIVCFGCSFVWGQGVKDNQTMSYLLEDMSDGKYRTHNLAYIGYGPHQSLRILETGELSKYVSSDKPLIGVIQVFGDHVNRVSGNYPSVLYGIGGPQYVLESTGKVKYKGPMDDNANSRWMHKPWFIYLHMSVLFQRAVESHWLGWETTQADQDLLLAIIAQTREEFLKKYGDRFIVILWTADYDPNYNYLYYKLKQSPAEVYTSMEMSRRYGDHHDLYSIPLDGHPSRLAHRRLAQFILEKLQKPYQSKRK